MVAVLHFPAGRALKAAAPRLCGSSCQWGGSSGVRGAGSVAADEEEEEEEVEEEEERAAEAALPR